MVCGKVSFMKTMLSCLAVLYLLGCVTENLNPQEDPAKYKPILGAWVASEQNNISITFTADPPERKATLNVSGDLRYGTWNFSNNYLFADFPNLVGPDGQPAKDSTMSGFLNSAGNLVMQSGGAQFTFRRADNPVPAPVPVPQLFRQPSANNTPEAAERQAESQERQAGPMQRQPGQRGPGPR